MKLAALAILSATVLVTGCAPYPIYKTMQPAARVTVRDQASQPVREAEATIISRSKNNLRYESMRTTKQTMADGTAAFESVSEWRVENTMLHGATDYGWHWCVRKDGYVTFNSKEEFDRNLSLVLAPGLSTPCPKVNSFR